MVVTRRLFLQDDATACQCDACFSVWYKWMLEQLPEDHWSPDLAELPERINRLRGSTLATWELYVDMMDDWHQGAWELA
jgi:hypothetical protein